MADIVDRLRFDAARCEAQFSKGVATNIEEAAGEIERLRAALQQIADLPPFQSYDYAVGVTITHDAERQIALGALAVEQQSQPGG